ncbi:glycine zipper domain-containing protein [Hyphobacterium marinum]|uniref:YMGG-like glycine zipper-containing protein n=1 Tax=Hyphobacterium marinum TaxID=3116574 RepID=A0ABU7M1T6_9PROT|nr:YMGG-like glycine zipper-containing protein [Hyphobacterium sp. Y6023]MEE2567777.1 YMGG-like glycine zipper-containing protein [Hyphobacterium sp. Y6023]
MRRLMMIATLAPAVALTACAGYENTTRNAAAGAALGAAAGAVIGNNTGSGDAQTGALIGAAVGAAGGAAVGCEQDNRCPWSQNNDRHSELYYDQRADRYYYINRGNGCTYWRNGEYRGC